MAKVTMPQLGESVAEGTIGKWLKQPGDHVDKYEPLLEVITDKVNAEVPSPFAGILKEILVEEGATVPNNAEIAVIETADEGAGDAPHRRRSGAGGRRRRPAACRGRDARRPAAPEPAPRRPSSSPRRRPGRPRRAPRQPAAAAPRHAVPAAVGDRAAADRPGNPDARMTPAVRRLLREHGLTAAQIVGTGGGGRITREDVTTTSRASGPAAGRRPGRRRRRAAPSRGRRRPPRPRHRPPRGQHRRAPAPAAPRARGGRRDRRHPASRSRPARTRSSSR